MPQWTVEEAVALLLGKDPSVVTEELVDLYRNSAFAKDYRRLLDLVTRAREARIFFDPVDPGRLLAWAERMKLDVPSRLVEAVREFGHDATNWKARFDEAERENASRGAMADEVMRRQAEENTLLQAEVGRLRERNSDLTGELVDINAQLDDTARKIKTAQVEKPVGARERDTMLKLVIGMAVAGYGYNPKVERQTAVVEIVSDLEQLGIKVGDETIRKYLREGSELIPPKEP